MSVNAQPLRPLPPKVQRLLALLVLGKEQPVPRDWLAEVLWPGSTAQRSLLRSALFVLRRELGPAACRLPTESRKTVRLDLSGASIDVVEFDRAVTLGDDEGVVRLYRGEFLKGWRDDWAARERLQRAEAYQAALQRLRSRAEAAPGSREESRTATASAPPVGTPRPLEGGNRDRELARLYSLVAETRTHLERAGAALEQLERRVALIAGKPQASDAAPALGRDQEQQSGKTLYQLGVGAYLRGEEKQAEDFLTQARAVFIAAGDPDGEAAVYHKLAGLCIQRGDDRGAQEYARRCLDLRTGLGDEPGKIGPLLYLGEAASSVAEAYEFFRDALEIAGRQNDEEGLAWVHTAFAIAPLIRHQWTPELLPDTVRHFDEALNRFVKLDLPTGVCNCLDGIVSFLWAIGRRHEAMHLLTDVDALRAASHYHLSRSTRAEAWLRGIRVEGPSTVNDAMGVKPREARSQEGEAAGAILQQAVRFALQQLREFRHDAAEGSATASGE